MYDTFQYIYLYLKGKIRIDINVYNYKVTFFSLHYNFTKHLNIQFKGHQTVENTFKQKLNTIEIKYKCNVGMAFNLLTNFSTR